MYRRLARNEIASHKKSDYEEAFMDVENYESGASPQLDKMLDSLNEGDTVDFECMAEIGITQSSILSSLKKLAEKRISIQFLKSGLVIDSSHIKSNVDLLAAFHEAGLVNKIGRESYLETKKVEQARGAAILSGERLAKALAITKEHVFDGVHPKDLARKHKLGVATIYRYIRNYSKEVKKGR